MQPPFAGIKGPVRQLQPRRSGRADAVIDPAVLCGLAKGEKFRAGLVDVHIDRIEGGDRGQRCCLLRRDQRTRRHRGCANATADRRDNARICQIDARCLDIGLRLTPGELGVVIGLGGNGVCADQCGIARGAGLGAGHDRQRLVMDGLIGAGIDLIEGLAGPDGSPLHEQAGADDAGDLRPDLGHGIGACASRQLHADRDGPLADRHHPHHRRRQFGLGLDGAAAAHKKGCGHAKPGNCPQHLARPLDQAAHHAPLDPSNA